MRPNPTWKEAWNAFREGFWSLMLPVIIFGGIFSGAFTANEAAVVACVYALIVELFIHRDMKFSTVKKVMVNSAVTSATLLIIVAGATCFGRYLTMEAIPSKISEAVVSSISQPWIFLPDHQHPAADYRHVHGHHQRHLDPGPHLPAHVGQLRDQRGALFWAF